MSYLFPRLRTTVDHIVCRALDPFGFHRVLEGLELHPDELPSLHRERRLEGLGL